MKNSDEEAFIVERLKLQILTLCEPHEPHLTMSALTTTMATIIVCAGPENKDRSVLKVAHETLKQAIERFRAYLSVRSFKMTEH